VAGPAGQWWLRRQQVGQDLDGVREDDGLAWPRPVVADPATATAGDGGRGRRERAARGRRWASRSGKKISGRWAVHRNSLSNGPNKSSGPEEQNIRNLS
jgi:hypothetical protein